MCCQGTKEFLRMFMRKRGFLRRNNDTKVNIQFTTVRIKIRMVVIIKQTETNTLRGAIKKLNDE